MVIDPKPLCKSYKLKLATNVGKHVTGLLFKFGKVFKTRLLHFLDA